MFCKIVVISTKLSKEDISDPSGIRCFFSAKFCSILQIGSWFAKNRWHNFVVDHHLVGQAEGKLFFSHCNSSWASVKSLFIFQLWAIWFWRHFNRATALFTWGTSNALFMPMLMVCGKQGTCCIFEFLIAFTIFRPLSVVHDTIDAGSNFHSTSLACIMSLKFSAVWFSSKWKQHKHTEISSQLSSIKCKVIPTYGCPAPAIDVQQSQVIDE